MAGKSETAGYRRGVVLGFTVAEVVLLFVFCLLLLLAPTIEVLEATTRPPPPSAPPPTAESRRNPSDATAPPPGRPQADNPNAPVVTDSRQAPKPSAEENHQREIPPDWKVIVPGQAPYISSVSVCAMTGLSQDECTPGRIEQVLKSKGQGEHNWPPIIRLREADQEFFAVGKAEITEGFARKIRQEVVPTLRKLLAEYKVDVVEVVGHTDEQPIQGKVTNLDAAALDVVRNGSSATRLTAADNAGLGYARALSIVQLLASDPRLSGYTIIPLSAAQLIDTSGKLSDGKNPGDVRERRRIEIRVRRSDTAPATIVR
jgi:outer membrane protein OmpA-like peptidoglycan-associated protein